MTTHRAGRSRCVSLAVSLAVLVSGAACTNDEPRLAEGPTASADRPAETLNFAEIPDGPAPNDFGGVATVRISDVGFQKPGFVVRDGKMVFRPRGSARTAAYYTSGDFGGGTIAHMSARFVFFPRGGTNGTLALVISRASLRQPFGIHLVITPSDWNVGVWSPPGDPAGLTLLQGGEFTSALPEDGRTTLAAAVTVNGPRAAVDLPDGRRVDVCDPRIARWSGPYATFESLTERSDTDSLVGFTEISARPTSAVSTTTACAS